MAFHQWQVCCAHLAGVLGKGGVQGGEGCQACLRPIQETHQVLSAIMPDMQRLWHKECMLRTWGVVVDWEAAG